MTGQPTDRPDWEAKAEEHALAPCEHVDSYACVHVAFLAGVRMGLEAAAECATGQDWKVDRFETAKAIRALLPEEKP